MWWLARAQLYQEAAREGWGDQLGGQPWEQAGAQVPVGGQGQLSLLSCTALPGVVSPLLMVTATATSLYFQISGKVCGPRQELLLEVSPWQWPE